MVDLVTEVYGRIERGGMVPSTPTLVRICQALRISADELLGLTGGPNGQARPATTDTERPELRPVIRALRDLEPAQVKLMGQVASALKKQ